MPRAFAAGVLAYSLLSGLALYGQPKQSSNWTVTGTVTDSATGQPIAGATVAWEPSFAAYGFRDRSADSDGPSEAAKRLPTDASGKFEISVDFTASGVRLFVSKAGYRSPEGKPAAALSLRAASQSVTISLAPQSAIEGRVLDAAGEALGGLGVEAVAIEIRDGRRFSREAYSKVTGASGEFRFDDIPKGAYFLRVAGAPGETLDVAYGPVYYPSASTQDQAQLLRAAPGKVITADFHIDRHKAYQIRGLIANMPLRRMVAIRLLRGGDPLSSSFMISPNGTFTVPRVAPGSYTVQAYTPGVDPPEFGETEVTVEDRDSVGVKVILTEGVAVSGHVEFRGSGSLEKYAVVYATPFNPGRLPREFKTPAVTMRPNGTFEFKNLLPGKYEISVRGLPATYLAEIHAGEKDVLEQGLTVSEKEPPTLAIVMKSGGGEVTGSIDGAHPGESFSVVLIAMHGSADIPSLVHAPDGRFHITGLSPGDYALLAWPESREIEYRNPAVLSQLLRYGAAVSLADGVKRTVALTPLPPSAAP